MARTATAPGPLTLAMDTSGDVCSVATLRGDALISEHTFRHGMHLSERLMEHVDAVLTDAEATIEQVDKFAVGIGPGSFTGTRIGVMAMKMLAALFHKPLIGVNGLEALAFPYSGLSSILVLPMLPCRAGVVFTCSFDVSESVPRAISEPAAVPIAELSGLVKGKGYSQAIFCGAALNASAESILEALADIEGFASLGNAEFPRAADIGRLVTSRDFSGSGSVDPLTLVPLYVSPPPITMPKQAFPGTRN